MVVDIDPTIFKFWIFEVRYYGLLFGGAFITGYLIMMWIWNREGRPLEEIDALVVYVALGVVIGARLGHCFFYHPEYYLANPVRILQVWRGGLASHGATIGTFFVLYLYTRRYKLNYLWLGDRMVIPIALATSFIRIGNFTNSEIVGRPTDLPWAVTFIRFDAIPRHPSQLYEATMGVVIFIVLLTLYRKYGRRLHMGALSALFLVMYFSLRFLVEFFKEYHRLDPATSNLTMGQYLSIPFVIAGIIMLIRLRPWLTDDVEASDSAEKAAPKAKKAKGKNRN